MSDMGRWEAKLSTIDGRVVTVSSLTLRERLSIRAAFGCATFAIFFGAYSLFNQQQDLRDEVLIEPPFEEPAEIFGLEPAA